jgi:tRNA(Ile)-lysidine synthase
MKSKQLSVSGQFLATVREHGLLSGQDSVLAAVSGGSDSVCLLDLLLLVRRRFSLRVRAFHLNHGLRRASGRDEQFVRDLCGRLGVELDVERADVAAHARQRKTGIEEAGRELRHRGLEAAAHRLGCNRIAFGHTADDNLETILLNLVRGTGPQGLAGIPVRRGRIIRPLLDVEHESVLGYLRGRGLSWVEDESNTDRTYRRNRLRSDVLPVLRELNPKAAANARSTARLLVDESTFLDELAAAAASRVAQTVDGRLQIDTAGLATYNQSLKRRIVKRLVPELDASAVERVLNLVAAGRTGRLSLTSGSAARLRQGKLSIERKLGDSR